jgi:hypothetical protein
MAPQGDAPMTVELTITVEACAPDRAEDAPREERAPAPAAAGPLSGLERAAFFAALRRKADARLAALG